MQQNELEIMESELTVIKTLKLRKVQRRVEVPRGCVLYVRIPCEHNYVIEQRDSRQAESEEERVRAMIEQYLPMKTLSRLELCGGD